MEEYEERGETELESKAYSDMRVDPPPSRPVRNLPCCLIPWKLDGEKRILSGMSETERSLVRGGWAAKKIRMGRSLDGNSEGRLSAHLVI